MVRVDSAIQEQVRTRAGDRCEYCRLPQAVHPLTFHVEHIIARQHRGETVPDNLAWACWQCNSYKGPNIAGLDPDTGQLTALFHPRRQIWSEHFRWNGPWLIGLTPEGRTTVEILQINHPDYIRLRDSLIREGVFP